jgi:hypothetical protein
MNDCSGYQGSPSCLCLYKDVTLAGIPVLKKDLKIPDFKEIIKCKDLETARNDMSARFFDIVASIWDGSNVNVVRVLSVPVFLFTQAVDSSEEAEQRGGEIREEEKNNLIITMIICRKFSAIVAGTVPKMTTTTITTTGADRRKACLIAADVGLDAQLSPVKLVDKIFFTEVTARLQQRANSCNNQAITRSDSTTTTYISTYMTKLPITCKVSLIQACYHFSSVMSIHTNTPDMVRFTCWATTSTNKDGKGTDD